MAVRPKLSLERTFRAPIAEVWELWTTREGIEAWWGPDGFTSKVRAIDVRPGGELLWSMTAVGADQVEFLKKAGMPLTSHLLLRYLVVEPPRRLVYREMADFIPGVEPYEVETVLELSEAGDDTRLVLTFDAMHNEYWSKMATTGREMELARLEELLTRR